MQTMSWFRPVKPALISTSPLTPSAGVLGI